MKLLFLWFFFVKIFTFSEKKNKIFWFQNHYLGKVPPNQFYVFRPEHSGMFDVLLVLVTVELDQWTSFAPVCLLLSCRGKQIIKAPHLHDVFGRLKGRNLTGGAAMTTQREAEGKQTGETPEGRKLLQQPCRKLLGWLNWRQLSAGPACTWAASDVDHKPQQDPDRGGKEVISSAREETSSLLFSWQQKDQPGNHKPSWNHL